MKEISKILGCLRHGSCTPLSQTTMDKWKEEEQKIIFQAQQQIHEHYKKVLMSKLRWVDNTLRLGIVKMGDIVKSTASPIAHYAYTKFGNSMYPSYKEAKGRLLEDTEKFIDELLKECEK